MHAIAVRHFFLIASWLAAAPALAGVGATSSGVTSTIGTQGTNASPEVQQQSAGFVQQNQQLQGQNAMSPSGVVLPGGVTNASGTSTTKAAPNSANPDAKPGDPNAAQAATPATPPPPPPPPPTYVSVVKHLTPGQDTAANAAGTVAVVPVGVVTPAVTPAPAVAPAPVNTDPATTPKVAAVTPPAAVVNAPAVTPAAANAAKFGASERAAETGVVSGGRGPAPDGYTFYVGFGIAVLLLVIAFGAYLSSQKDEATRRPPV